jgi:hypothetical protein
VFDLRKIVDPEFSSPTTAIALSHPEIDPNEIRVDSPVIYLKKRQNSQEFFGTTHESQSLDANADNDWIRSFDDRSLVSAIKLLRTEMLSGIEFLVFE